jgi:hypothetical protein
VIPYVAFQFLYHPLKLLVRFSYLVFIASPKLFLGLQKVTDKIFKILENLGGVEIVKCVVVFLCELFLLQFTVFEICVAE